MTTATWNIQFTATFKKDLEKIDTSVVAKLAKKLDFLFHDPFQKRNNVTPLINPSYKKAFRLKIPPYRLIYRLISKKNAVLLIRITSRENSYKKISRGQPVGDIHELISIPKSGLPQILQSDQAISEFSPGTHLSGSQEATIEEKFIDEDELWLAGIPQEYHSRIVDCATPDDVDGIDLPPWVKFRIDDYITNNSPSHIEKIYSLEGFDGLEAIAQQPLSSFLLALDPQQRAIIEKPLDGGPLLIRGGPGSGKTLVCLYRMKRMLEERPDLDLFSDPNKDLSITFVSYANALVNTNKALFHSAIKDTEAPNVSFSTLDSIVDSQLASWRSSNKRPSNCLMGKGLTKAIENHLIFWMLNRGTHEDKTVMEKILKKHDAAFLADEFTHVIQGNDINSWDHYRSFSREGRGSALKEAMRQNIWLAFQHFTRVCKEKNWSTIEGRRQYMLHQIQSGAGLDFHPDMLIVDEVQDISLVGRRLVAEIVKEPKFLTLAVDTGQSIYVRGFNWKNTHPALKFHRGNSFGLQKSYRMTKEITRALLPLRLDNETDDMPINCQDAVFSGPKPIWLKTLREEQVHVVGRIIKAIRNEHQINPGQIAVILRTIWETASLADDIVKEIKNIGIEAKIFNKEEPVVLDGPVVNIITAHSAKGLEFPFVIVPDVSDSQYPLQAAMNQCGSDEEREEIQKNERRLLYVAATRAARQLWILADNDRPSPFLDLLNPADWNEQEGLIGSLD